MNAWEIVAKKETSTSNKINYTKIPEGVTYVRALDATPHARWSHWIAAAKRTVTCLGKGKCPICDVINKARESGETSPYTSRQMFSINVYNYNTKQVEILEQGRSFFEELLVIREDNGEITDYDIKIRRRGMDKNTTYRLDVYKADATINPSDYEEQKTNLKEYLKEQTPEEITNLMLGKREDKKEESFIADEAISLA